MWKKIYETTYVHVFESFSVLQDALKARDSLLPSPDCDGGVLEALIVASGKGKWLISLAILKKDGKRGRGGGEED